MFWLIALVSLSYCLFRLLRWFDCYWCFADFVRFLLVVMWLVGLLIWLLFGCCFACGLGFACRCCVVLLFGL